MPLLKASDLFQIHPSLPFKNHFHSEDYPWIWVTKISEALNSFNFSKHPQRHNIPKNLIIEGNVFIHETAILPPYGHIIGPTYIGANTELRSGVFIRGNVIVGENCVLGNSCEFKNCLLIDSIQTGHFNYIGDSILGTGAHFGAGAVTANVRLDKKTVTIKFENQTIDTNLKKLGALIGEFSEIGCNAVLQPGTILGKKSMIGPTAALGGVLPPNSRVFAPKPTILEA